MSPEEQTGTKNYVSAGRARTRGAKITPHDRQPQALTLLPRGETRSREAHRPSRRAEIDGSLLDNEAGRLLPPHGEHRDPRSWPDRTSPGASRAMCTGMRCWSRAGRPSRRLGRAAPPATRMRVTGPPLHQPAARACGGRVGDPVRGVPQEHAVHLWNVYDLHKRRSAGCASRRSTTRKNGSVSAWPRITSWTVPS
jgi:hypothetical protein